MVYKYQEKNNRNVKQQCFERCGGKKGFSIVELVIAVSIIAVFIISITFSFSLFLRLAFSNTQKVKAAFLTEEAIEAVKFLKQSDWEGNIFPLESGTDYFLKFVVDTDTWEVTDGYELIDGKFDRRLVLEDVNRDAEGKIVEPPNGNPDAGTKKITVFVSWLRNNATTTESFSTYIADI